MRLCSTGSRCSVQAHFTSAAVRDPSRLHPRTLIGINNISIRTFNCCEKLISSFDHDPHVCNWTCHEHSCMHSPTPPRRSGKFVALYLLTAKSPGALLFVMLVWDLCGTAAAFNAIKIEFLFHPPSDIQHMHQSFCARHKSIRGDVALNKATWQIHHRFT